VFKGFPTNPSAKRLKSVMHGRRRTNNTPGVWRRITASCPDSNEIYITLTNQMNHTPGCLNQCRRLRWNIEKAFDQQEQKLDVRRQL
jgi:IS4 transposase